METEGAIFRSEGNLATYDECNVCFSEVIKLLENNNSVTLDIANARHISSTGIGRLASIHKQNTKSGKKLKVININKDLKYILEQIEATTALNTIDFIFSK